MINQQYYSANLNLTSAGTTSARCTMGHTWTYAGSIHFNLEGYPCDCGQVIFHSEPCKCCDQPVQKHLPNPNFK